MYLLEIRAKKSHRNNCHPIAFFSAIELSVEAFYRSFLCVPPGSILDDSSDGHTFDHIPCLSAVFEDSIHVCIGGFIEGDCHAEYACRSGAGV
jgi:hypothetical protein